jgi:L-malate glycosyltransferase
VEEGKTGFLAPVGDVDTMTAAVARLAETPSLWLTMSKAARSAAVTRFSPEPFLDAFERIYRTALASSSSQQAPVAPVLAR